MAIRSSFGII
jgi:hypothetical protein